LFSLRRHQQSREVEGDVGGQILPLCEEVSGKQTKESQVKGDEMEYLGRLRGMTDRKVAVIVEAI
jgi:hypothetical protein